MRSWEQLSYYSTWTEMGFFFIVTHPHLGQCQFINTPHHFFIFYFCQEIFLDLEHLELKQNTTLYSEITSQKGCLDRLGDRKITKNLHVPGSYCVDFYLGN